MKKVKEWLSRYWLSEIMGSLGAVIAGLIGFNLSQSGVVAAYFGTIGENLGFYGVIIFRDVVKSIESHKNNQLKYGVLSLTKDIRNIILEFGPSEILDSLLIRPFLMFVFPQILGNMGAGIFIGKIAADIVFYIPAIISYELRKKHLA